MLFAVADVFSSQVTKAVGNEALISSSHCGYLIYDNKTDASFTSAYVQTANDTIAAIMYSRACYGDTSNELQCGRFLQFKLASTFEMNVSCFFQSQICLDGSNAAFQVKSE